MGKGPAGVRNAGGPQDLVDDRAASPSNLVAARAAAARFQLEAPKGLGPDARDVLKDGASTPVELNRKADGLGRGDYHEAGAPEADGRARERGM
eukprot:777861-Alexandrium_andersonii.AAC.1